MSRIKKYCFSLYVDFEKYSNTEFNSNSIENETDKKGSNFDIKEKDLKVTKITDLEILKSPRTISFLDEFKTLRKCSVSMIDFKTRYHHMTRCPYKCFWDRCNIPNHVQSIGCPIRYIPSRAIKVYDSFISKEKYSITEPITEIKKMKIEKNETKYDESFKNNELKTESLGYYETDGIFCSFNCCLAFLNAKGNNKNSLYRNSKNLLLQIYNDISSSNDFNEIIPAGHWRTLIDFGGFLSIEDFRSSFNKVKWVDRGIILNKTFGRMFEEQIKL